MSGVDFVLPSSRTTGDTVPYPPDAACGRQYPADDTVQEATGRAEEDGGAGEVIEQSERDTGGGDILFAWETVTANNLDTIRSILLGDAPWRGIERVTTKDLAITIMDMLQSEVDRTTSEDYQYRMRCVKCLRALSKHYDILPSSLYIKQSSVMDVKKQDFGGAFSDIHRGRIVNHPYPVCLKQLRIHQGGQFKREKVQKAFCHEALIWRQLRHDNILPFYGVSDDIFRGGLCLVLPWIVYGDIHEFLLKYPKHDRRGWVWDIAAGIRYLHSHDPCIVHKDIRGANILVGSDLRGLITDFGISIVAETQLPDSLDRRRGNIRWLPPEMVSTKSKCDVDLLRQADIYSFGWTIIEIYTGMPPHSHLGTDGAVLLMALQKKLPPLKPPDNVPNLLWHKVVLGCLAPSPRERPSADKILDVLLEMDGAYFKQYLSQRGALSDCPPVLLQSDSTTMEFDGRADDDHDYDFPPHHPSHDTDLPRSPDPNMSTSPPHQSRQRHARFTDTQSTDENIWDTQVDGAKDDDMIVDAVPSGPVDREWAEIDLQDPNALTNIMTRDAPWRGIECVTKAVAPAVMDKLQSELDKIPPDDLEYRKKYVKCLLRLGKTHYILPSQLYVPKDALRDKDQSPTRGGGFSDVYSGEVHGHPGRVCLKLLRINRRRGRWRMAEKMFCMEALSWRQVSHENVLPFYGVSEEIFENGLCFISPWMENGTVLDYLEENPWHDRRGWVWDVAAGLNYLHQLDPCIVHKDIRGANLLVGDDIRCYLFDFGISIVAETLMPGTGTRRAGNICWLPPEVINDSGEHDNNSLCKVDIYSFGCTMVEMYTNEPPYANLRNDAAIIDEIRKMEPLSPPSSDLLPSQLWDAVVVKALSPLPEDRPSAADIMSEMETLYPEYLEIYRKESRTKPLKRVLEWTTACQIGVRTG